MEDASDQPEDAARSDFPHMVTVDTGGKAQSQSMASYQWAGEEKAGAETQHPEQTRYGGLNVAGTFPVGGGQRLGQGFGRLTPTLRSFDAPSAKD